MTDLHRKPVDRVLSIDRPHPVRVAVDGSIASGKTPLADCLEERIRQHGARSSAAVQRRGST